MLRWGFGYRLKGVTARRTKFDNVGRCPSRSACVLTMEKRSWPFELANRAYFAESITDRSDEFFDQHTERHIALLVEQEAGISDFHVPVEEDQSLHQTRAIQPASRPRPCTRA